jgi:FkbH-like protein
MSVARPTSPPFAPRPPSLAGLEPYWLPEAPDFDARVKALDGLTDPVAAWVELVALAETRLDFVRTMRLDRSLQRRFGERSPPGLAARPVKLALLGSSTIAHLAAAIRIAGLRRGIWVRTYEGDYGQYVQELLDPGSGLHDFKPNTVLFAFDAAHLLRGASAANLASEADAALEETLVELRECWRQARQAFQCQVIQQTLLPVSPALLGSNEHRLPGSRLRLTALLNAALRVEAVREGVDLLALDDRAAQDGLARWHDPALWYRAKQEVSPAAAPMYGELVARLIGAQQGLSRKCLVLDLDNTLWGGTIGDDGLEGSVILAVCSKNEEANAVAPFDQHPEMVLKRTDIACFAANWGDKVANLRAIARELNIGLDSMVFLDDNPYERDLVRRTLPVVAVPELPDDPALFPACLADAGYFEGLAVTEEDRTRTYQYQTRVARETLAAEATDLPSYLSRLQMQLIVRPFDRIALQRVVQLINKTNQFNLTTRRYTEDEVLAVMTDPLAFGLQFRLLDRFGDNGVIAIVIGRMIAHDEALIDTWLMSCRVLGRTVEEAMLSVVGAAARRLGARRLVGEYRPTAKNRMVSDHYRKLGFTALDAQADGARRSVLALETFVPPETFITLRDR